MKVILLTDVPKVGNKYDVKDLKSGFAQNVLIARGLATLATPRMLAKVKNKKNLIKEKIKDEADNFSDVLKKLNNKRICIKAKCNDKGHLFKAVKESDVASAVREKLNIEVNENDLLFSHIKEVGEYAITLQKGKLKGEFKVEVVKE